MRRRRLLAATGAAALGPAFGPAPSTAHAADGGAATDADFERVLMRLEADALASTPVRDPRSLLAAQLADGTWPDVRYDDRGMADWLAMRHLERTRSLAAAYRRPGDALQGAAEVRRAVQAALAAWLVRRPDSVNWWHNTVGQQRELMPTLVLLRGELPDELLGAAVALLNDPSTAPSERITGQNLLWYAMQQLTRGALRRDASDIAAGSAALQAELRTSRREGLQPDLAFHQHGPQLYSGGYGLNFLVNSVQSAALLDGTPWAYDPARIGLLAAYALEGIAPLVRGGWLDWGARGREIGRRDDVPRPRVFLGALPDLARMAGTRGPALRGLADALRTGRPGAAWRGNKVFWSSDFMVHQTERAYVSVKMCSRRTVGTESGNGENLLGFWLPFGCTYLLRRGDEYDGLPPVWDWAAVPGITAPATVPKLQGYQRHPVDFAGGLSDGVAGVAAMALDKHGTRARKAWFLAGDQMVALGAGIASTASEPVRTTLNQARWVPGAVGSRGSLTLQEGRLYALDGHDWFWHDGITYRFLGPERPRVAWHRRRFERNPVNPPFGPPSGQAEVMQLAFDHGSRPDDAAYAYAAWLGAATASDAGSAPAVQVLANTPGLQAVAHDAGALVQAAFHQPGSLRAGDVRITVESPCLVMLRRSDQAWQLGVGDPTVSRDGITLRVEDLGRTVHTGSIALHEPMGQGEPQAWRRIPRT
jgi:chondroitin AC lyase